MKMDKVCNVKIIGGDQSLPPTDWHFNCKKKKETPDGTWHSCMFSGSTSKIKPVLKNRFITDIKDDPCEYLDKHFHFTGKEMLVTIGFNRMDNVNVRVKDTFGAMVAEVSFRDPCNVPAQQCFEQRGKELSGIAKKFDAKTIVLKKVSEMKAGKPMKIVAYIYDDKTIAPENMASITEMTYKSGPQGYGEWLDAIARGIGRGIGHGIGHALFGHH